MQRKIPLKKPHLFTQTDPSPTHLEMGFSEAQVEASVRTWYERDAWRIATFFKEGGRKRVIFCHERKRKMQVDLRPCWPKLVFQVGFAAEVC